VEKNNIYSYLENQLIIEEQFAVIIELSLPFNVFYFSLNFCLLRKIRVRQYIFIKVQIHPTAFQLERPSDIMTYLPPTGVHFKVVEFKCNFIARIFTQMFYQFELVV
jgi:hypothetical protein